MERQPNHLTENWLWLAFVWTAIAGAAVALLVGY
jgi:hypothetical protein